MQMDSEYVYNEVTGTLHIRGFCPHTKGSIPYRSKVFATYDDAAKYGGNSVRLCRRCQAKFEEMRKKTKQSSP